MNSLAHSGLGNGADIQVDGPAFQLKPGTIVEVGAPGSSTLRRAKVLKRFPRQGSAAGFVGLEELDTGAFIPLEDSKIAHLCRTGEFRIVFDPDHGAIRPPPPKLELTPAQQAYCDRCMAYVDACEKPSASRSRAVLVPRIEKLARERGEAPPGFTTVLSWIDLWTALGPIRGNHCFHHDPNKGNRNHKLASDIVEEAVENGITSALAVDGTGQEALKMARAWLDQERPGVTVPEDDWPDVRSVQARMASRNRFEADSLTFGDRYASKKHGLVSERPRSPMPLDEVECDNTFMDVIVVDETKGIQFGRPNFLCFTDRCSGHPLGYAMDFEGPSYAGFMSGLRHVFYPKPDLSANGLLPWEAYGRPRKLFVDNAGEFIGNNMKAAAGRLNMQVAEFRPGNPWLKGAQERLLGIINAGNRKLPGATKSNVEDRKRYADAIGKPVVTIGELRLYVEWWVRNEYVVEPHEGLGPLRTMKGVPRQIWRSKIADVKMIPLPDEYEFVVLAGDASTKAVNRKGVRWDNIRYSSPELTNIITDPKHRTGRGDPDRRGTRLHGTRFQVRRNPFDLGRIYLTNHLVPKRQVIELRAQRPDYADGLTLHQHRVIMANHTPEALRKAEDPEELLMRKRREIDEYTQFLLDQRRAQGVQKKLARFLEKGWLDHERSVIVANPVSESLSRDFLDPRDPVGLPRPPARSPDAASLGSSGDEAPSRLAMVDGLPTEVDRGAEIAAAREARKARSTNGLPPREGNDTRPKGSSSAKERRARRLAKGWGSGSVDAALPDPPGDAVPDAPVPPDPVPAQPKPTRKSRKGQKVDAVTSSDADYGGDTSSGTHEEHGGSPAAEALDDSHNPPRSKVDLNAAERRRRRQAKGWGSGTS